MFWKPGGNASVLEMCHKKKKKVDSKNYEIILCNCTILTSQLTQKHIDS